MRKNMLILIALFLCLAGFVQAQPPMPAGITSLESYALPGYYLTCRNSGQSIRLVQGGNGTNLGQFTVVPGLIKTDATTVSFLSAAYANNYLRHQGFVLYAATGTGDLFSSDGSWIPRPGWADPNNPRLVSFESQNYRGRFIIHDALSGSISVRNNPVTAASSADEKARATFMFPNPQLPSSPYPGNKSIDVLRDVGIIWWKPGSTAATHNVFWGTDLASVTNATVANPLGTTLYQALDVNNVHLDRLPYGITYYWRVEEVNAPSSPGTISGDVWRFKTELEGYPLLPANIIDVTAVGGVYPEQDPNSTANGKGLDANDMHSTALEAMWVGQGDGPGTVWIKYEFDKIYMLHDMLVWNYNGESPGEMFGAKDVNISYSQDGNNWTAMPTMTFNEATGDNKCVANTTVEFNQAIAKFVKITFLTSYADMDVYGLSEVRFSAEPTRVKTPSPSNNATNQAINAAMKWKAGRYAAQHYVYISDDINDVNGVSLIAAEVVTDANFTPALDLNKKYYWRVDEVNMANVFTTWDGPVWTLTTSPTLVIDNFEVGYGSTDVNFIWATWKDGVDVPANGGSMIGKDIAPPGLSTVNRSGGHSMVVNYDDSGANAFSQVTAQSVKLPIGRTDWTLGHPTAMVIWFRGDPNNIADQLYAKLNSTKIVYTGEGLTQSVWRPFVIDLASINLENITSLTIGLEKNGAQGGKGIVYFDDIALYGAGAAPVIAEPVSPGNTGLVAYYAMENNVNDGSGNGLNGTLVGTPTYVSGMAGRGMAMQFNGTTDCVDLGNKAAFNPTGSFSVSLWANITTWTSGWGNVMVGNRGEGTVGWQLRRYSNSNFCFTTRGISNDDTNSNGNPPLNEWVNITCVYDSGARTKAIYFNGVLNRTVNLTGTVTQIPATTHDTYIGARANSGNTGPESFFAGLIDEVRIYDRALSAGEAAYLGKLTP